MISGTSMAAPHMTGITALVMQYLMEAHGMTSEEAAAVADNLMVSTATPLVDTNGVLGYTFTDFESVANGTAQPTFNGHELDMTGDVLSYNMLVDTVAPKLVNNTVSFYEEDGRIYVTGTFQDDGSIASVEIIPHVKRTNNYNPEYFEYGMDDVNPFFSELIYDARLGEYTFVADVTEYAHKNLSYEGEDEVYSFEWTGNVYIFCGNYGGNDRAYILNVDTSDGLILTNTSALLYVGSTFELNVIDNTGSGAPLIRTSSNPEVANCLAGCRQPSMDFPTA